MRAYPDRKTMPNRKQRKVLRKIIFEQNRTGNSASRRARAERRKPGANR